MCTNVKVGERGTAHTVRYVSGESRKINTRSYRESMGTSAATGVEAKPWGIGPRNLAWGYRIYLRPNLLNTRKFVKVLFLKGSGRNNRPIWP